MSCKYDIIDEGGRKRVRALRPFTVQGRDVCPMELGGYVYDANTLSQDGNCWIFSGSLEYPGVRVMDEAIVDMGINLPKNSARPKATIISGNSRIMGAISFETRSFDVAQTPAMFEQGGYTALVGSVPVKNAGSVRVRIPTPIFAGTVGKVAITSTAYEARLISLNEAGIVVSVTAWTVGGPAVTLTSTAPYILVDVRKVGETAISPADITEAGVSIRIATEAQINIFNSSIVSVYNGSVANAISIFQFLVSGTLGSPGITSIQNSYVRAECVYNRTSTFVVNADFTKVNYNMVLTAGVYSYVSGSFRNTNMNSPESVTGTTYVKRLFDVSDCPDFEFSEVTFPDLAAMITSGKTFYFKNCNMPVGSAIHYYDPKVNVWDNIDFTKAMADLGKVLPNNENIVLVSSNKQGWYRMHGKVSKSFGALIEALSSVNGANFEALENSYDTVIYKDHTITGAFEIKGCNVFGGTLGGASKITNTTETAMVIDGNFRIEGNAQVTDTPLKGTGYIGDNAELKNGNVEGYIYMDGNAKYIPETSGTKPTIRILTMRDDSKVLRQRTDGGVLNIEMYNNSVINALITVATAGKLIMKDNAKLVRTDDVVMATIGGLLIMKDNAILTGTSVVTILGEVELVGRFILASSGKVIYGKQTISDVSQIGETKLPPTKITW